MADRGVEAGMASALATAADLQDGFRIGNVLGRSIGVLSRHVLAFVLVMAVARLPTLLPALLGLAMRTHLRGLGSRFFVLTVIVGSIPLLLIPVTQAVVYYAAFQDLRGQKLRLGESIKRGLRRFFALIGTWICMALLCMIGFVLLIVPGFIAMVATAVAVPVCVVERLGPIASIQRSRRLTKGHRWKIVGLGLLLFVAGIAIAGLDFAVRFGLGAQIGAIVDFVVQSAFGAFSAIVFAVAYHDLRVAREGLDTDRIAAVFD
jgi:hypothetical protein